MDVTRSHTYAARVDAVMAMLRVPDTTVAMHESMGSRDVEVIDCSGDDSRLRVESTRVVDVQLPGFAKKVLKPTNTLHEVNEWRAVDGGAWEGTFAVEVQGAPVRMSGTMRLTPHGATCTEDITVAVTVKVPLIGGKIADWAAKNDVQRTLEGEFAFGDQWLAAHPA